MARTPHNAAGTTPNSPATGVVCGPSTLTCGRPNGIVHMHRTGRTSARGRSCA